MKRFILIALLILLLGGCASPAPAPQATYTPLPTYTSYPTYMPLPPPTFAQVAPLPAKAETPAPARPSSTVALSGATLPPSAPATSAPSSQSIKFVSVEGGPPDGTAKVTVQTKPGASCFIQYKTPAGTNSTAQGLAKKTADGNGAVSWSWKIGSSTRPGKGMVQVTCDGQSSSSSITIQ